MISSIANWTFRYHSWHALHTPPIQYPCICTPTPLPLHNNNASTTGKSCIIYLCNTLVWLHATFPRRFPSITMPRSVYPMIMHPAASSAKAPSCTVIMCTGNRPVRVAQMRCNRSASYPIFRLLKTLTCSDKDLHSVIFQTSTYRCTQNRKLLSHKQEIHNFYCATAMLSSTPFRARIDRACCCQHLFISHQLAHIHSCYSWYMHGICIRKQTSFLDRKQAAFQKSEFLTHGRLTGVPRTGPTKRGVTWTERHQAPETKKWRDSGHRLSGQADSHASEGVCAMGRRRCARRVDVCPEVHSTPLLLSPGWAM